MSRLAGTDSAVVHLSSALQQAIQHLAAMGTEQRDIADGVKRDTHVFGEILSGVQADIIHIREDIKKVSDKLDAHTGPGGEFQKVVTTVACLEGQWRVCKDEARKRKSDVAEVPFGKTPDAGYGPVKIVGQAIDEAQRRSFPIMFILIGLAVGASGLLWLLLSFGKL